jgi:endonuclease/exonuclease/phosphatase family metal-dependent hydrolase
MAAPDPAAGAMLPLVVVSFNIQHGVPHKAAPVNLSATAAAIRRHKPDVAVLQEVDRLVSRTQREDQAAKLAQKTGLTNHEFGTFFKIGSEPKGPYGMATLSRLPIVLAVEHRLLPDGPHEPRTALVRAKKTTSS